MCLCIVTTKLGRMIQIRPSNNEPAGFVGAESLLLLGFDRETLPIRSALRRFSAVIREFEEGQAATRE